MFSLVACASTEDPAPSTDEGGMPLGSYTQTVTGMHAPITVELTVAETSIVSATIVEQGETVGVGDVSADMIVGDILKYQSLDVDLVASATITSAIVKGAFKSCLAEAGADMDKYIAPVEKERTHLDEYTADVAILLVLYMELTV